MKALLKEDIKGPGRRFANLTHFIPQEYRFAEVDPKVTMVFLGDVMSGGDSRYVSREGYEMHLYPGPQQMAFARELLKRWDAVIGHHLAGTPLGAEGPGNTHAAFVSRR